MMKQHILVSAILLLGLGLMSACSKEEREEIKSSAEEAKEQMKEAATRVRETSKEAAEKARQLAKEGYEESRNAPDLKGLDSVQND